VTSLSSLVSIGFWICILLEFSCSMCGEIYCEFFCIICSPELAWNVFEGEILD